MWQKIWTQGPLHCPAHAHKRHLQLDRAEQPSTRVFSAVEWRTRLAAKCQQVPVNIYKYHIHSLLYARGSQRKMRSELWLVCGRGKAKRLQGGDGYTIEKRKWGWRREGKWGEWERFPKLIKCSEGWKLPASIPVPLDKLARCSLQFLCSAEVASWGHHQGVRGGGWGWGWGGQ